MASTDRKLILITGGHGFIGSHIARRLFNSEYRIRIVDIVPSALLRGVQLCDEFVQGNLCDISTCERAVEGAHTVLHLAATMGGMGTIHDDNNFVIYEENHTMTKNILEASINAGVTRLLYASSACVYPKALQASDDPEVSLREVDVWTHTPPKPQGLYGLEKLVSELLIQQFSSKLDIRIARFHNVYGPGGAWCNGREKAPAAMLRKALAGKLQLSYHRPMEFEIWGDGTHRRSFLYIEDAVDAVIRLLDSGYQLPLNIGSDASVTTQELARTACTAAGVDFAEVICKYDEDKPTGVVSRNSNNDLVTAELFWCPTTPLEEGMRVTGEWIENEIHNVVDGCPDMTARNDLLKTFQRSKMVRFNSERIVFAILLPITSRGSSPPHHCLSSLAQFAFSLNESTWRDTHSLGSARYHVKVYVAIDSDDPFLFPHQEWVKTVLNDAGIMDVKMLVCSHPPGYVCALWRDCAREAYRDGCDYYSLMGDDITLRDEGWMRAIHAKFTNFSQSLPFGFGCVAFTDTSFPGMPTFPVIHRTHMVIFEGVVVPEIFVNQDGDPFLFQLYRRWGCSVMIEHRVSNGIGGVDDARYTKEHARDWTFKTLDSAVYVAGKWLKSRGSSIQEKLTLDIVIPCYRVDLKILRTILELKPSDSCTVMFIIIIDDPSSPNIIQLEQMYAQRPDVRIRTNASNLGASESRNKGMRESAADWVHFLDDDVVPNHDLIINAENVIRTHPNAAGFVGTTLFPPAETIFTTAVHIAGVTYFWDIATNDGLADDVPWGVTANLIARRSINDGVMYDRNYPKTGGGEDIDFCRKKRDYSINELGGKGFIAAPDVVVTHPWWNGGARSYWRFYMWSFGDGALIKNFPSFTYRDIAPNSAELFLASIVAACVALVFCQWRVAIWCLKAFAMTILANTVHDCYRHLWKHPERNLSINSNLDGFRWFVAVVESSLIRISSEVGRLHGMLSRGELLIGKRFDWFAGRLSNAPIEEKVNSTQRFILFVLLLSLVT